MAESKVSVGKVLGYVASGILCLFVLIAGLSSFYTLEEYERGVVTRLGEFQEVVGTGLHWKIPFVDSVHIADTRMDVIERSESFATKDGQSFKAVRLTVNHKILPDNSSVLALYREFGPNFDYENRMLAKIALDVGKAVFGKFSMEEFMPNREVIRDQIRQSLRTAAQKYGINVEQVQISNVEFSDKYKARLDDIAAARAKAEAAKQLEREAEYMANKVIEDARGRSESKKLEADAQAHKTRVESIETAAAIQREGEAKAAALEAQADVLNNSEGLVELTKAEAMKNWNGEFNPNVAMFGGDGGGAGLLPFLNVSDQIKK